MLSSDKELFLSRVHNKRCISSSRQIFLQNVKTFTKSSLLSLENRETVETPSTEGQLATSGTKDHEATERPLSDEYEPSAPMATPMPSTFAGKI